MSVVISNAQNLSTIYITPTVSTIAEGASHTLQCVATGYTNSPLISWYFEDQKIDEANSLFSVSSDELVIQAFSSGLAGAYRCIAESSIGKIASFSLGLKLACECNSSLIYSCCCCCYCCYCCYSGRFQCGQEHSP